MVNEKLLDEMVDKWWKRMRDQFDKDADLLEVPGILLLDLIKKKYLEGK